MPEKALIVGNWKMNLRYADVDSLVDKLVGQLSSATLERSELVVCPSHVFLPRVLERTIGTEVVLGAQDCSDSDDGAYTGQVSADMLSGCGCSYVIVGHSERRMYNAETDITVAQKARRALRCDLTPIICVGESLQQRERGEAYTVIEEQLLSSLPDGDYEAADIVIAYEPVWAIGTGIVARPHDVEAMHAFIYKTLAERFSDTGGIRILYGGSVKPDNADAILACDHVHGALVGGASLDAESFLAIASCA